MGLGSKARDTQKASGLMTGPGWEGPVSRLPGRMGKETGLADCVAIREHQDG